MLGKGMVRTSDLVKPPPWSVVAPMMRAGLPLAMRNVISFGTLMAAGYYPNFQHE